MTSPPQDNTSSDELWKQIVLAIGYLKFEAGEEQWQRTSKAVLKLIAQHDAQMKAQVLAAKEKYQFGHFETEVEAVPVEYVQQVYRSNRRGSDG